MRDLPALDTMAQPVYWYVANYRHRPHADYYQLLIFALGSLSSSTDLRPPAVASDVRQQPHFKQAEMFYAAAQRRMGVLLSRSGEIEAQCFFLAGVYLMATIRPLEGWKMFVQALASCQAFYGAGVEHAAENERDRRLRETIYWTCFKSEL